MTQNMTQAYQQTPWRIQLQRFGLFLLGLVVIGLVAGLYLFITAESVSAGVEIQSNEWEKESISAPNFKSEIPNRFSFFGCRNGKTSFRSRFPAK
jgi:hypothetical protein